MQNNNNEKKHPHALSVDRTVDAIDSRSTQEALLSNITPDNNIETHDLDSPVDPLALAAYADTASGATQNACVSGNSLDTASGATQNATALGLIRYGIIAFGRFVGTYKKISFGIVAIITFYIGFKAGQNQNIQKRLSPSALTSNRSVENIFREYILQKQWRMALQTAEYILSQDASTEQQCVALYVAGVSSFYLNNLPKAWEYLEILEQRTQDSVWKEASCQFRRENNFVTIPPR